MLSPQELELLTAHVDGELSASQRRQVASLLERSGEAREMLRCLEADAARLRGLPKRTVPLDLTPSILEEIAQLARQSKHRPTVVRVSRFGSTWTRLAIAAGVLLAVGFGSFWFHALNQDRQNPDHGLAKSSSPNQDHLAKRSDPVVDKAKPTKEKSSPDAQDSLVGKTRPVTPEEKTTPVTPPKPPGSILAANSGGAQPNLERVENSLPTIAVLHELDKPEARQSLTDRLSGLKTARVELTSSKEGAKAFDRLQRSMEAKRIRLHVDPATKARLEKPLVKTDVVLFIENLKAEELIDVLQHLATVDKQGGEQHFEGPVIVTELTRWDRPHLTDLLGIDPTVNRPSPRRRSEIDLRRDLAEQTTQEVVAALEGHGVPRPGVDSVHHAYVSHLPSPKSRTPELKRFLDARRPPQNETLQVLLLVLRHVGG